MRLQLSVPTPEASANLTPETRPKQVKEWLEALPAANFAESAKALCDALGTLNRAKLEADDRLKVLEAYRPALHDLLPALEAQFTGVPLPLPEKGREVAALARHLATELAYGYKLVLLDCQQKRFGFNPAKQLPLVIQRCLAALGQLLSLCYNAYTPTPAGVWSEIHQIYRYAVEENVPDEPVPELDGKSGSITLSYKQSLLLALADPYRLMQGEVSKVLEYVRRFASHVQLQEPAPVSNPAGLFAIRLDEDRPARALSQLGGRLDPSHVVLLNAIGLARLLHQQVSMLESGSRPDQLQLPDAARDPAYVDLLRRLLKFWGMAPKRHYNRLKHDSTMEMCIGLRAVHNVLNGGQPFVVSDDETPLNFRAQPAASSWQVLNESAGGISLSKLPGEPVQVRVGEVVGIRAADDKPWSVGVVRWLHSNNQNHLELGVQMLSPSARPVAIKPTIAPEGTPAQLALLFPENPKLKQPAAILAGQGTYRPMREFMLHREKEERPVRARDLLQQTATFELFQFG